MKIESFKDMLVWQKAIILVTDVYEVSSHFPDKEKFGLISQIRRCAVSVPSNIAEGYGRNSTKSYTGYLKISRGSLFELETQLIIASRLGYMVEKAFKELTVKIAELSKMLNSLINSLEKTMN